MKLPNLKIAGVLASLLLPMSASAVVYVEIPDAGELLGSAQDVGGVPPTTSIVGILTPALGDSADLFKFAWGGGPFYANTVSATFDSQLFLFDAGGVGVLGNDDGIAFAGPAFIETAFLPAGTYYIGVSGFDYDPYDAGGGLIFPSFPFEPVYGPIDGDALASWAGGSGGGEYIIDFREVDPGGNPVPEGGMTLVMLGMAVGGIAWARRKLK